MNVESNTLLLLIGWTHLNKQHFFFKYRTQSILLVHVNRFLMFFYPLSPNVDYLFLIRKTLFQGKLMSFQEQEEFIE